MKVGDPDPGPDRHQNEKSHPDRHQNSPNHDVVLVPTPDKDAAQRMADEGDATDGPGHALHVVVDLVHQLVCHRLEILHV